MREIALAIDGRLIEGENGESFIVKSPSTGEAIASVAVASTNDVDRAFEAAERAQPKLAALGVRRRAEMLFEVARSLETDSESLAADLTREQGKPLHEARLEVAAAAKMWRDAAEISRHRKEHLLPSDVPDRAIVVKRVPHGVVSIITPWNFPITIPTEYLCAGLAMGNALVWKPSELTPIAAARLHEIICNAGFPKGSVNIVHGMGATVGAQVAGHPRANAVGFTGSPATGRAIASGAGLKPTLLELGGNNATVVLPGIDVSATAALLADAAFRNCGQVCSATERVLVHHTLYDELTEAVAALARLRRVGEPLDADTQMGPLNNQAVLSKVERHIEMAVADGGTVVAGGGRVAGAPTPLYFEPTVIKDVSPNNEGFLEETFGPVAMFVPFQDDDEAVELVNNHRLGLISGILGPDTERSLAIARRLKAGIVNVGGIASSWQPHTPFGGFSGRESGIGRLGGEYTLDAMSQLQTFVLPSSSLP